MFDFLKDPNFLDWLTLVSCLVFVVIMTWIRRGPPPADV